MKTTVVLLLRPVLPALFWILICYWIALPTADAHYAGVQSVAADTTYKKEWQQAEDALQKSLPKSALEIVKTISERAKKDRRNAQYLKAILYRTVLAAETQEQSEHVLVKELTGLVQSTSDRIHQALLQSVLAEFYYQYYQRNRWKYRNRSTTTDMHRDDFRTWDAVTIISTARDRYLQSVRHAEQLSVVPVRGEYQELLAFQRGSEQLRPTVFDVLAHRALEFLSNSANELPKATREFEFMGITGLSEAEQFSKTRFVWADSSDTRYQTILLYQELTRRRLRDSLPDGLIDLEIRRYKYARSITFAEDTDSVYQQQLRQLTRRYTPYPASDLPHYELADFLYQQGEYIAAKQQCDSMPSGSWSTRGALSCLALRDRIFAKELHLTVPQTIQPEKPFLVSVSFRNVARLYCRLIAVPHTEPNETYLHRYYDDKKFAQLLTQKPLTAWSVELPLSTPVLDYKTHRVEIQAPAVPVGKYILLTSERENFAQQGNALHYAELTATRLAFSHQDNGNGTSTFWVMDATTGKPQPSVTVQMYHYLYDNRSSKYQFLRFLTQTTNQNGKVELQSASFQQGSVYLELSRGDDYLFSGQSYFSQRQNPPVPYISTLFFTDRSIYRPGQVIYYKGILVHHNDTIPDYTALTGKRTRVELYDANYQKIQEQELVTNGYGSFQGFFTAPANLNGQITIRNEYGSVIVRVEEYKRPKFEAAFEPVKKSIRLNDTALVKGFARTYSGTPTDGAAVRYRVVRKARYPLWRYWWLPRPETPDKEITHGETTTDGKGMFTLTFPALPDKSQQRSALPVFDYEITADITDINGETHSATTSVSAAYTAYVLSLLAPERLERRDTTALRIRAVNLQRQPAVVTGMVQLELLRRPARFARIAARKRLFPQPDRFAMSEEEFSRNFPADVYANEDRPDTWATEQVVFSRPFTTSTNGNITLLPGVDFQPLPGVYRLSARVIDPSGDTLSVRQTLWIDDNTAPKPAFATNFSCTPLGTRYKPGTTASLLLGSTLDDAVVLYQLEHKGRLIREEWMPLRAEQRRIEIPITTSFRGNVTVHLLMLHNYRAYRHTETLFVPWSDKELTVKTSSYRDKTQPGAQEEWRFTVTSPNAEKVIPEILASMYDASLDALTPHYWSRFAWATFAPRRYPREQSFGILNAQQRGFQWFEQRYKPEQSFDRLNTDIISRILYGSDTRMYKRTSAAKTITPAGAVQNTEESFAMETTAAAAPQQDAVLTDDIEQATMKGKPAQNVVRQQNAPPNSDSPPVQPRTQLQETAFFFPQLQTDSTGALTLRFTMPESLTKWRFMLFAHTPDIQTGYHELGTVTQKELMLLPNVPRFVREADTLTLPVKITSMISTTISGMAQLTLVDAYTQQPLNEDFLLKVATKPFHIEALRSTVCTWQLVVPEGVQAVVYRVTASAGQFSDGEEAALPVLPNRMFVTETLPLWVRGNTSKTFELKNLLRTRSKTLRHHRLTLDVTPNPVWYAIQALPVLMEYPHECSEQTFNRYFANALASHIINSQPRIKTVVESWKTGDALLSNLEKNADLKNILLQETPWVLQSSDEKTRKQRIGILFDLNRMTVELDAALSKLEQQQGGNGGFSWFPGMPESRFISQYIVAGLGHLQQLNVTHSSRSAQRIQHIVARAIRFFDQEMLREYRDLQRSKSFKKSENYLHYAAVQYLYARSYFPTIAIPQEIQEPFTFWMEQAATHWAQQPLMTQAMITLALHRFHRAASTVETIVQSFRERAMHSEELGMYWKENSGGWWWYQAPIETQAALIEVFEVVANDPRAVEELKIWLLKQKQVQDWKTTKATSEACYALLLRGIDLTASNKPLEITVGAEQIHEREQTNARPEAGTGQFRVSWSGREITPAMGRVTLRKNDDGIAWGGLFWQYFERLEFIQAAKTPLSLDKKMYRQILTDKGQIFEPITPQTPLRVGDLVKIRLEIRSDRDMEYIHLRDMRGAGLEPVSVLSTYKWSSGLGYYESVKDASMNFFISWLPKGVHILEYTLRATIAGQFSNGISTIQSMYAPEFASHTAGQRIGIHHRE